MGKTTAINGKQRNTKTNGTRTKIRAYVDFKAITLLIIFGS
jgi:hypothetical protein